MRARAADTLKGQTLRISSQTAGSSNVDPFTRDILLRAGAPALILLVIGIGLIAYGLRR